MIGQMSNMEIGNEQPTDVKIVQLDGDIAVRALVGKTLYQTGATRSIVV